MLAEGLPEAFQLQAEFCRQMGSPTYAEILGRCHDDLRAGGLTAKVMDGWVGRPVPEAVVLRLAGAVHRLALCGDAPALARHYPSCGGAPAFPGAWEAFCGTVEDNFDYVRRELSRQVQTNEVNRCAALMGGFRHIAARTNSLPLRTLEIGTSAGLNQNWDRYRYRRNGEHLWGDPGSPVEIGCNWHGAPPALAVSVTVSSRAGCDIAPLDASDDGTALRLQSFIWPDQVSRLETLRAAIELARRFPPQIVRATAPDWLAQELRTPKSGVATVVFHSLMWWYMSRAERDEVTAAIDAAGRRASADAPLAWLQLEPIDRDKPNLALRLWPGGDETVLASAHGHGSEVWWD